MRGLLDHGMAGKHHLTNEYANSADDTYKVYFGLGHSLKLINIPTVFKVSLAGLRLGNYLVQSATRETLNKSFLDIGTGSGVHALLMRRLGNSDVNASDISQESIAQAKIHERINFEQGTINFSVSDLFESFTDRQFQTITFNPPGWRTPSSALIQKLEMPSQSGQMPISSMFYGEEVVSRFLEDLPKYLAPRGRAIVGLNSLIGIHDLLNRYNQKHKNTPPLIYKLVERHTFPLLYYTHDWHRLSNSLKNEFENLAKQDLADYATDQCGNIYWSYEIIEFSHSTLWHRT